MGGRLRVVVTSPRTPSGQLSWPAWDLLRSGPVRCTEASARQLPFLRDAAVEAAVVPRPAAEVGLSFAGPPAPDVALARALHAEAAGGTEVRLLADGDADAALLTALGDLVERERAVPLEVVYGSWDPPGARLLDVVAVMDRLRSPGGCPWDAEQTHASLKKYLLEEAYEAYQALEDGDGDALREELGDVLLQVVFHARLAQEAERPGAAWSVDDVAGDLVAKLVRRHPHVFAGASADDLEGSWERLKREEKGRTSVTEGVPLGQPALALAAKLQKRGGRVGAPLPARDGLGGALWDLVARCREAGLDPEEELRAVARSYADAVAAAERAAAAEGRDPGADDWARALVAAGWDA